VTVIGTGLVTALVSAGTAGAQTFTAQAAGGGPLDSLGAPVGLSAIGLGVVGMVTGVLRRKKATVQPENQRKVP
jgi:hypothetical protein